MKDNSLAPLVLAEVLFSSEEAISQESSSNSFVFRSNLTPKYYVGRSSQSVLLLPGAMRALTRLERETSAADSDSDEATVPQSRVVPANAASPQQDSSEEIREAMSELKVQTSQEKGRASESTRRHPYNKIDVGWSMRCMDLLFKASFSDFITDERNVECAANHLLPIIKDYKLRQVAQGVEWMCRGWKPENAAKLLRILFAVIVLILTTHLTIPGLAT